MTALNSYFIEPPMKEQEDYKYKCSCCDAGFYSGYAVQVNEERFCDSCVKFSAHITFYRDVVGLSCELVSYLTEFEMKPIN